MSGSFELNENRHFIIEFKNNDVVIFAADHNNYPTIPLYLTSFSDIKNQKYLNIDKSFTSIINNINAHYPILKVCYEEKIIITKNHKLFLIEKNDNQYNISEIIVDYKIEKEENKFAQMLDKIEKGEQVHIGSYLIDLEVIKRCVKNSNVLNTIEDEDVKMTLSNIIDLYKEKINDKLSSFANENNANMKKSNNSNVLNDEKFKILYDKLVNGQTFNIGNFKLNFESLKGIVLDESILDRIDNIQIKDGILKLVKLYHNDKRNYEEITGGSGNENSKVKVIKSGFVNHILIMSLAGFTTGIVITFAFIILKKYFF